MGYILKHYDTELIRFDMFQDIDGVATKIVFVNENCKNLLPLDLECSNIGLAKWLSRRTIPSNRAYVQNFLAKLGLNERNVKGIIDICKGLSLNDCYWVVNENFEGTFAKNNLFDNRFSNILANIAFTGHGSIPNSLFRSSPEFTTNGMLAKSWRRKNGKILLYKSGSEGAANTGNEPYSEYLASQVAKAMGINAISYNLSKWQKRLCSTCELFTSKSTQFIPVGSLVKSGGIKAVIEFYKSLGEEYYDAFLDMIVFDAVILNTDRHFGNFGFLVDSSCNKIIAPAPLFDHGLSLLNYAMEDDLVDWQKYASTRVPATYNDFIGLAKQLMGAKQKEKLRKLMNFKFKKHSKYNLSDTRLKVLEKLVVQQARNLLN